MSVISYEYIIISTKHDYDNIIKKLNSFKVSNPINTLLKHSSITKTESSIHIQQKNKDFTSYTELNHEEIMEELSAKFPSLYIEGRFKAKPYSVQSISDFNDDTFTEIHNPVITPINKNSFETEFCCYLCGNITTIQTKHILSNPNNAYQCEDCGLTFKPVIAD